MVGAPGKTLRETGNEIVPTARDPRRAENAKVILTPRVRLNVSAKKSLRLSNQSADRRRTTREIRPFPFKIPFDADSRQVRRGTGGPSYTDCQVTARKFVGRSAGWPREHAAAKVGEWRAGRMSITRSPSARRTREWRRVVGGVICRSSPPRRTISGRPAKTLPLRSGSGDVERNGVDVDPALGPNRRTCDPVDLPLADAPERTSCGRISLD